MDSLFQIAGASATCLCDVSDDCEECDEDSIERGEAKWLIDKWVRPRRNILGIGDLMISVGGSYRVFMFLSTGYIGLWTPPPRNE